MARSLRERKGLGDTLRSRWPILMRRCTSPNRGLPTSLATVWSRSGRSSSAGEEHRMSDEKRETVPIDPIQATLSTVFREEAGKLVGALLRLLGNFEVAEEIVQDALLVALERWPIEGIPAQPGAWLLTVARRRAIDQLRRDARYRDKLALLEHSVVQEPDDRLRLMFTCCHPALSRETQVILTLRAVCGFTTAEIAHAFLASASAVARRLVRARKKIVQAGIPYRVPRAEELDERL